MPGGYEEILSHPSGNGDTVRTYIFDDHRFALFYWAKWTLSQKENDNIIKNPPCLITLDWHEDLCFPSDREKKELQSLDLSNLEEIGYYAWARSSSMNDCHILEAAYLNLIGDIYVVCRKSKWDEESIHDLNGDIHKVYKFKTIEDLEKTMPSISSSKVFFDIDLDFFTLKNPLNGVGKRFTYLNQKDIQKMFDPNSYLIRWIFDRMACLTVAKEPEHCGGLKYSNRLMNVLDQHFFYPTLLKSYLGNGNNHTVWKHLTEIK